MYAFVVILLTANFFLLLVITRQLWSLRRTLSARWPELIKLFLDYQGRVRDNENDPSSSG
jgi:hypothetical protein